MFVSQTRVRRLGGKYMVERKSLNDLSLEDSQKLLFDLMCLPIRNREPPTNKKVVRNMDEFNSGVSYFY